MLSLYLHIPFCASKCRYCGFYSTQYAGAQADAFLSALAKEIHVRSGEIDARVFETLYIGGGTPTVLSIIQMQGLMRMIHERARVHMDAEFTVEANPNSLSPAMLSLFREQGVNRISIGVQSFFSDILAWLGRVHTPVDAVKAVESSRKAGFTNIGIDLIYGVPGLTGKQWRETLKKTAELRPSHISAYSLSVDEGSKLQHEMLTRNHGLPGDDVTAGQYEDTIEVLGEAGYRQYEISNFCLPRYECRHNLNYWDRGEYVGMGPGAWSYSGNRRRRNVADLGAYLRKLEQDRSPADFEETLDASQAATETLFLGLRKTEGIDLDAFAKTYGVAERDSILNRVQQSSRTGYYVVQKGRLLLSRKGMLLSNDALTRIIS